MHSHIMPPKLALNSCCSLKCNAFILCIHTRAGCLGDTQNGRYIRDKMLGGMTTMETWRDEDESLYWWCNKEREHKKQMADEWEETRHCYSTYKDCSGQVHQRVQNTKTLPTCISQWKLTVNSQNRVAMTQPRYRTQTGYILTDSLQTNRLFWRGAQYLTSPAAHRNKDSGQWCNSPNSHEDRQRETRHTARTAGSAHRGEPTDMCRLHNEQFLSHSAGRKIL